MYVNVVCAAMGSQKKFLVLPSRRDVEQITQNSREPLAFYDTAPFVQAQPTEPSPEEPVTPPLICHQCGLTIPEGETRCPQDGGEPLLANPEDSHVGILLDGRYRLIERIGEGGVGAVYRAIHIAMKKTVAVKILHREYINHPEFSGRFKREAKAASRLEHPNIVTVSNFGTSDGISYLVMECLEGKSLSKLLEEGTPPITLAVQLLDQVLVALSHAHHNGVIHRDLKSANVFLCSPDDAPIPHIKLLDFGFAKITKTLAKAAPEVTLVTQPGIVFGTPAYISPEQGTGAETDHRTDIYAAGVLAFELLTGQRPFAGDTPAQIIVQHVYSEIPSLRKLRPEISPALEKVVLAALAKKKESRIPSADSFRRLLAKVPEFKKSAEKPSAPSEEEKLFEEEFFQKKQPSKSTEIPVLKPTFQWWMAALLLIVGAVIGVLLLETFRAPTETATTSTIKIKTTAKAEALLAEGKVDAAELELRSLAATDANANLLLGNLYFTRSWWSEGLDAYEKAIELSPSLLQNQSLLSNVTQALQKKTKDRAAEILKRAKEAAHAPLIAATLGDNPEIRKAATALLIEAKQEGRIDQVDLALRDLSDAETCEARREAIVTLDRLGDARATATLLQRYQTRLTPDPDACLRPELAAALKNLGVNIQEPAPNKIVPD
jgi:serine/threonine protein kinase